MSWYKKIKDSKSSLENRIGAINELIKKFNLDAGSFKD
jgi:hypothetical protein